MRLSDLIRKNLDQLSNEWAAYARKHIVPAARLSEDELKNSSRKLYAAVADDMDMPQDAHEKSQKAQGQRPGSSPAITEHSSEHALTRAREGFSLSDLASEFRAARASVMRLLLEHDTEHTVPVDEIECLNEAIDEGLTVSIAAFDKQLNNARDMFLGVLGHDLRNPLGAIGNSARLILADENLSPISAKAAARIYSSAKRVNSMVEDLLDFTRTRVGEPLPVRLMKGNMGETVSQVVDELRAHHPYAKITYETAGDLYGRWDFGRIAQVVSNLGGNALQHGDTAKPIAIRLTGLEEWVVLAVHNEGPVIPQNALTRIFDPLTRGHATDVHDRKGSIGLGLYICRQIALAHGGTIDVASDGHGTTFFVRIPRSVEEHLQGTSG